MINDLPSSTIIFNIYSFNNYRLVTIDWLWEIKSTHLWDRRDGKEGDGKGSWEAWTQFNNGNWLAKLDN